MKGWFYMSNYILGLDIGIASVGWAVINKDNKEIVKSGVRLFDCADPSKNQERRTYRGVRRNIRRRAHRLSNVEQFLVNHGIIRPTNINETPLELRNKGLNEKLSKEEIFVSLFNIAKHRGVSYIEDIEEAKDNDSIIKNIKNSEFEFPCQIQADRLEKYSFYRGTHTVNDEVLINTFTIGMYEKEARKFLQTQQKYYPELNDTFIEGYIELLKKKREYYIGPGNNLSRTNYGVFKTSGTTLDNLFDELRGKCSIYNGKDGSESFLRASTASYSVQHYNLLNDLCNIKYNGEKLTQKQKTEVLEFIKNAMQATKITVALKNLYKYNPSEVSGYRVDKKEQEENHNFEVYRAIRKELEHRDIDISKFSIETLDAVADILTLNTETDGMIKYFENSEREEYQFVKNLTSEEINAFIEIRRKKSKLFDKWSSFSYHAINKIVPEMLETGDEQHTCITRMQLKKYSTATTDKLDVSQITNEIYNPVVVRAITQTVKITNALLKEFTFTDIVIEMARENNEKEQLDNIKKMQKNNEELANKALKAAGLTFDNLDFRKDSQMMAKLKLWYKQSGKCMYSGDNINIDDIINGDFAYEIDHIIPISISFDDSQSNKVLVKTVHNQKKSNKTPFQYLSSGEGGWSFEQYKAYVLDLCSKKLINKRHRDNYLNTSDITKQEVIQGFINRNINDTRYASKVILNELQHFFKHISGTKIKVINGSFTSQFRKRLKLEKNRSDDFRHHAQDAMICCYSLMSLQKYNDEYINIDTGEIVSKEAVSKMDKQSRQEYLTFAEADTRNIMLSFHQNIKMSYKIDTKINRGVSDQTIKSTREFDGEDCIIGSKDIYCKKDDFTKLKAMFSNKPNDFLMYKHDPKTWEKLMKIVEQYPDAANPFIEYRKEFGSVTKYAKKDNGPPVTKLKYIESKLGKHIDISQNYDTKRKVVLLSLNPYRADLYYNENKKKYILVPIQYNDFKFEKGKYLLPIERYTELLQSEGVLSKMESFDDLQQTGFEFIYSFYKNSIIELVDKDGVSNIHRFHSKSHNNKNYFETKGITEKFKKQTYTGITGKIAKVYKYNVDILGNHHKVEKEKLILTFSLDNKMI